MTLSLALSADQKFNHSIDLIKAGTPAASGPMIALHWSW